MNPKDSEEKARNLRLERAIKLKEIQQLVEKLCPIEPTPECKRDLAKIKEKVASATNG